MIEAFSIPISNLRAVFSITRHDPASTPPSFSHFSWARRIRLLPVVMG
jgi:hypothetical protein